MTERSMSCRELIEFLAAYLDGELARDERARFDAHLAVCPYCRDYLESYRETVHLGKRAFEAGDAVPEDVPAELVDAILAARARR
jgi:anti-sigma factor RsiW